MFNKSIAGYHIFNSDRESSRMIDILRYYRRENHVISFSAFMDLSDKIGGTGAYNANEQERKKLVEIIAYCIMPTHFHIILRQMSDKGISMYMNNVQNSYTRYFNIKNKRKGPLWESRFKSVLVETDEQLLHLTRYVHLNPVTAYLVDRPDDWAGSSYNEYVSRTENPICEHSDLLNISREEYKNFVEENIQQQRELAGVETSA